MAPKSEFRRLRRKTQTQPEMEDFPPLVQPAVPPPPDMYLERQVGGLCAVHAMNNALGAPHFNADHLREAARMFVDEVAAAGAVHGETSTEFISSHMAPNGNFSIEAVAKASSPNQVGSIMCHHESHTRPHSSVSETPGRFMPTHVLGVYRSVGLIAFSGTA